MPFRDPEKRREYHRQYMKRRYATDADFRERQKERIARRKRELLAWIAEEKKKFSCIKCGEDDPICLDFHHRDPNEKDCGIAWIIVHKAWGKERILKEMTKCDVLCSNCHRKLHHKLRGREVWLSRRSHKPITSVQI